MVITKAKSRRARRGNILILSLFLMIALLAMVALAVDVGYLYVTQAQLQRTADASAMAAAWELIDADKLSGYDGSATLDYNARVRAAQFAALNPVLKNSPGLDSEDVKVGYIADPSDPTSPQVFGSGNMPNSVYVRIRRTGGKNGEVPLFFARVLGYDSQAMRAEATAALLNSVSGFQVPYDGSNLQLLPFTLDLPTWQALCNQQCTDNYTWDAQNKQVYSGGVGDGVQEVNLFPVSTEAGNRGTVDIGNHDNSTDDIARQVLTGISPDDMSYMPDSKLEFGADGTLQLQGDTGISAGLKDELTAIIGEPRVIPIFTTCANPGNNCTYTICMFCGVRIMDVKLTGAESTKKLIIQPCNIVCKGAIPGSNGTPSNYVYSPVWLVR